MDVELWSWCLPGGMRWSDGRWRRGSPVKRYCGMYACDPNVPAAISTQLKNHRLKLDQHDVSRVTLILFVLCASQLVCPGISRWLRMVPRSLPLFRVRLYFPFPIYRYQLLTAQHTPKSQSLNAADSQVVNICMYEAKDTTDHGVDTAEYATQPLTPSSFSISLSLSLPHALLLQAKA